MGDLTELATSHLCPWSNPPSLGLWEAERWRPRDPHALHQWGGKRTLCGASHLQFFKGPTHTLTHKPRD